MEENLPALLGDDEKKDLLPIREDLLKDAGLNKEEMDVVHDYFEKMRYGPVAAAPLECTGNVCQFAGKCPLARLNKLPPPGTPCPIETALIKQWASDLANELGVDLRDVIDNSQILNIVALRLYDKRAHEMLGKQDNQLIIQVFRSMSLDGTPIYEPRLNPLLGVLRENHKMRDRDMETLVATREAKSKAVQRTSGSVVQVANAMDRVRAALGKDAGRTYQGDKPLKELESGE